MIQTQPTVNIETGIVTFPAGCFRGHLSEKHKLKLSLAFKGKAKSQETKDRMSLSKTGTHFSDKAKLKMSLSHKGVALSEEHKLNIGQSLKGRVISDETKVRMSQNSYLRGKRFTGEDNPFYGKHHTEETLAKLRSFRHSEETKRKLSELNKLRMCGRKGQTNSSEHNRKIGKANAKSHLGIPLSESHKKGLRRYWRNLEPDIRNEKIKAMRLAARARPTIPEQKARTLLDYFCPGEYEYTGD